LVAAELAAALDLRLVLVHAVHDPPPFPYGDARVRELGRGRAVRDGHRSLEATAADFDAVLRVTLGDPVEGLDTVCRQEDAELVVVGSRGHSGVLAALVGSVSTRLASTAECPIVVVPPDAGGRFVAHAGSGGSIVCGFDGSADSERALRVAEGLAARMNLELLPIFVDPLRGWHDAPPIPVQVEVGDPVQELRERATREDVRLLAVGSRGRGALRGALLGSVSAALAASAPVPVLVVPATARAGGLFESLARETSKNGMERSANVDDAPEHDASTERSTTMSVRGEGVR
jgi:nucleotide-binding universal stress UspA family protein